MNLKEKILAFMEDENYRPLKFKELCEALEIESSMAKEFLKILNQIEDEGKIIMNSSEKYGIPDRLGLVIGVIEGHPKGYGFLIW